MSVRYQISVMSPHLATSTSKESNGLAEMRQEMETMRAEMQAQKDMLAQILTAVRPPASPSSETELEPVPEVEAEPEEMEESKKGEKSSKDDQKKRGKKKR